MECGQLSPWKHLWEMAEGPKRCLESLEVCPGQASDEVAGVRGNLLTAFDLS